MGDRRDIVDISFLPNETPGRDDARVSEGTGVSRPWLGVLFDCCGVYARIHRTRDGRSYAGHCPKCNNSVRVGIGRGGTSHRMFRAE